MMWFLVLGVMLGFALSLVYFLIVACIKFFKSHKWIWFIFSLTLHPQFLSLTCSPSSIQLQLVPFNKRIFSYHSQAPSHDTFSYYFNCLNPLLCYMHIYNPFSHTHTRAHKKKNLNPSATKSFISRNLLQLVWNNILLPNIKCDVFVGE